MSTTKKVKLSPDTPSSPDDTIEVGRDHDLDEFCKSKTDIEHNTPPESLQVSQQDQDVRLKDPMKIKLILQRVFDFCSVESLKNCRLVSTAWRDESLKAWRNKAVLRCTTSSVLDFKFRDYLQLVRSDKSEDDDEDEDDSVKFTKLKNYPFKRFALCLDFYDDWNEFPSKTLRPISDTTRYLRINVDPFIEIDVAKLKNFLSNFHSLEFIHFHVSVMECDGPEEDAQEEGLLEFTLPTVKRLGISHIVYTLGWEYALKWFPNLEALSIKYEEIKEFQCLNNLKAILRFVKLVRESGGGSVLAFKELELLTNPKNVKLSQKSEEIVRLILACNFPLERLSITFGWEMIYQLLESCKDTLQFLKASFEFDLSFTVYKQQFVKGRNGANICMAKLEEASIGNGFLRAMDLLTLLELPLIKKLTIEKIKRGKKVAISYPPSFLTKGKAYERLETLEILDNHTMISPFMIETFATMMPHLVHLTIPLDKEMFQIVCEKFRGLRTLNISSVQWPHHCRDELDDESVTGISKEVKDGAPRRPNITDLTLLTDLQISCDWKLLENQTGFTDHSVIHGFLHLPRLYSLSIAFETISEEIRAKLLDHVKGNLYIQEKPNDGAEIDNFSDTETESDIGCSDTDSLEVDDSSDDERDSSDDEY